MVVLQQVIAVPLCSQCFAIRPGPSALPVGNTMIPTLEACWSAVGTCSDSKGVATVRPGVVAAMYLCYSHWIAWTLMRPSADLFLHRALVKGPPQGVLRGGAPRHPGCVAQGFQGKCCRGHCCVCTQHIVGTFHESILSPECVFHLGGVLDRRRRAGEREGLLRRGDRERERGTGDRSAGVADRGRGDAERPLRLAKRTQVHCQTQTRHGSQITIPKDAQPPAAADRNWEDLASRRRFTLSIDMLQCPVQSLMCMTVEQVGGDAWAH